MAYKFRNIVINEKGEYSEELGKLNGLIFHYDNEQSTLAQGGNWYKLQSRKFGKALPVVYLHKKSPQCAKLNPKLEDSTCDHLDVIHLDLIRPCLSSEELFEAVDGLQKAAFADGQRNMQGQFRHLLGINSY